MNHTPKPSAAIIGGGPAGLMAAEVLAMAGVQVDVYDAMPSVGRKFLLAGIGGLNITHSEEFSLFCSRYGEQQSDLQTCLDAFTPMQLCNWIHDLGVDTFVGSSGRVFPTEMKAAPLLRAWLHRLRSHGVRIHVRTRWLGWHAEGGLRMSGPEGEYRIHPQATVFALGGASWPKLGSDGSWKPLFEAQGVNVASLESANCGFEVHWSDYLRERYAGTPLKNIAMQVQGPDGQLHHKAGEALLSAHGLEGSLVYAFSRTIRHTIAQQGQATVWLDLLPNTSRDKILHELIRKRAGHSLPHVLKTKLGISGVKLALVHEHLGKVQTEDQATLADTLKALPITLTTPRPIAEAISTAGGVRFDNLNPHFMLKNQPGHFVAGEMLDWDAPTGGYLLTACLATGLAAGKGALQWIKQSAN
ncbi:TIGR03862 family flavoprotein [Limnobacter litoralis]|uniref:NAD(FAD)-utilizing dehydrogenase n=1 Tax=Limnobacter litoralis TaxID=481366 RepID=A0ABQ5YSQ7_9BURK|nr:TIGR03862 family flavoprotein [Limnobacter litoralis]GLR26926.1 NAD(FAD)-utilizing dehydrogenase [Limnobacter litoralis]